MQGEGFMVSAFLKYLIFCRPSFCLSGLFIQASELIRHSTLALRRFPCLREFVAKPPFV
jgi:hypothetical protein